MDNRIANDMISSGMIPSGEKKKEDLNRTQYGSTPSPSKLMDAYKSMYDKKDEVINEMVGKGMGITPVPKPGGITPVPKPGGITPYKDPKKAGGITPYKKPETTAADRPKPETTAADRPKPETKSMIDRLRDRKQEVASDKDAKRERLKKIMADNESVDLLAAYHSIYEHHKKDADGNTIPHEGEEVNEAIQFAPLLGKIATGLKATKAGTLATKALTKVKTIAKSPLGQQTIGQGIGGSMSQPKEKSNKAGVITTGADLFDIVKGKLLDEGLSEEEIKDIMLVLTPDEILSEINENV